MFFDEIKDKIKQISIKDYLETVYGCEFKRVGNSWFCLSPLRAENNPSFSVKMPEENFWYDFGIGEGGDIFKLVQKLENCTFMEAYERLKNFLGIVPEMKNRKVEKILKKNNLDKAQHAQSFYRTIVKTSNEILIRRYFKTFGLPFYTEFGVAEYTSIKGEQFVVFPCPDKTNIISLECRAIKTINGYIEEVRDEYGKKIKRTIGNKYPWVFYRTSEAIVTESIFDCLAGELIYGNHLTLVALNGVGNVKLLPDVIHKYNLTTVHLALDNDEPGKIATQKAIELIPNEIDTFIKKDHVRAGVKDLYQLIKIKAEKEELCWQKLSKK
ncbi:CHC2 zinc finger domain-containing protein [Thermodesulfovibrio sp. 3907-1M]|uniref:CHC2 zinc finger domain-containing protein n=1 Tax=Thermodesulfovibrio autotrophicus TaxID=3118333 RepID=A0AAU8GX80_9BACT